MRRKRRTASDCNPIPSAINPRRHAVRRQVLRLYFCRQRFGLRHRSAMSQAIRLCGEHGLRFGVPLFDDCYRSVAVWKEGTVKSICGRD